MGLHPAEASGYGGAKGRGRISYHLIHGAAESR
jgi:hypothetical protein